MDEKFSAKTIRRFCLECSGNVAKYVTWCPCHGQDGSACELWPHRFGTRPDTFRRRYGPRLLDPASMPSSNIDIDLLPAAIDLAAKGAIAIDGYHQPAVKIEKLEAVLSPAEQERRRKAGQRMRVLARKPR